jgi:hypothetical protein
VNNPNDTDLLRRLEPDWRSVREGTQVVASDGRILGVVQEKRDDGLFVRSIDGDDIDYLVPPTDIASIDAGGVKLSVNSAQAMRAHPERAAEDASATGGGDMTQPG